jgi:predicted transcriptional regulator
MNYNQISKSNAPVLIVNLQIINSVQFCLSRERKKGKGMPLPSYNKVMKALKTMFAELMKILRSTRETALQQTKKLYEILSENHWRERRKKQTEFS